MTNDFVWIALSLSKICFIFIEDLSETVKIKWVWSYSSPYSWHDLYCLDDKLYKLHGVFAIVFVFVFYLYLYAWYYIYKLDDKLFKLLSVSPQSIYAFLAEPLNWQRNVYEFPRRNILFHPKGNMVDRYCVNIFCFFWEIRLCKLAKYDSPEKFSVAMIFTEMMITISVILIWWWCL